MSHNKMFWKKVQLFCIEPHPIHEWSFLFFSSLLYNTALTEQPWQQSSEHLKFVINLSQNIVKGNEQKCKNGWLWS